MKQKTLKTIYNLGGFAPFHSLNRRKVLVLMYHRFSEAANPHKISRDEFEEHLSYLAKHNNVLSLDEVIESAVEDLPPNPTVITIDDGYRDAYDIAFPLLGKYKLPATLYVITDFLDDRVWLWTDLMRYILLKSDVSSVSFEFSNEETIEAELGDRLSRIKIAAQLNSILKTLSDSEKDSDINKLAESLRIEIPEKPTREFAPITWDQAKEMDKSIIKIESHTTTHPILTNVGGTRLKSELEGAKERLEGILERQVDHFCYPNGSLNKDVQKAVEKAGYKSAVTTEYGFNDDQTNPFLLKRIDASPGIANFAQSVSGFERLRQKMNI